jgi:hypothetical protein
MSTMVFISLNHFWYFYSCVNIKSFRRWKTCIGSRCGRREVVLGSYIRMHLVRMLRFLLIFLCLIVTVADWLGYFNPNIQTWLLAASTHVAVLTYVVFHLWVFAVYLMCTNASFHSCRLTWGAFFSSGSTVLISLTLGIYFSIIGWAGRTHVSVLSIGCLLPRTRHQWRMRRRT